MKYESSQTFRLTLDRRALLAAHLFASEDADRYLLAGVRVQPSAATKGKATVIATNGRALIAIELPVEAATENFPAFTIPTEICKKIKVSKGHQPIVVELKTPSTLGGKTTSYASVCVSDFSRQENYSHADTKGREAVSSHFCNWAMVCNPATGTIYSATGNAILHPQSLLALASSKKIIGGESGGITVNVQNTNAPMFFRFEGNTMEAYGVIMPLRGSCGIVENESAAKISQPDFTKTAVQLAAQKVGGGRE